jgi:deoxyribose-phosphate aldolase
MVRRDGAEARKERIELIARTIQAALFKNKDSGSIMLSKTVAELMLQTGLTRIKTMEYLELLQTAGQFEIDHNDDKIKRAVQV